MPLSVPTSRRALSHTRAITAQVFLREDGLWDIDAHLTDTRTSDTPLATAVRPAGMPIHDLWLRLTVDQACNIVAVEAATDAAPYPGDCDAFSADYEKLIGLNLLRGFRNQAWERLGKTLGCTHLTELAQVLPTVAVQALARLDQQAQAAQRDGDSRPFQVGSCKALRVDGAAVAKFYPRWAVISRTEASVQDDITIT